VKQKSNGKKTLAERFGKPATDTSDSWRVSYGGSDPKLLHLVIAAVVDNGDAVVLGRTRDGGAVVLTILSGDEKHKFYSTNNGELADNLNLIRREYGITPLRTDVPDDKVG
jgi:hypothetical protein